MRALEAKRLLDAARSAADSGERAALATVVRVHGSAYRREGAKMLVSQSGAATGMISGGCLEPQITAAARHVMELGAPKLLRYELDEDVMWGLGLGCGGAVEVHLEPVATSADGDPLRCWLEMQARGDCGALITVLGAGSGRLLWRPDVSPGTLGHSGLDEAALALVRSELAAPAPRARMHRLELDRREFELFVDVSTPPLELVIFGGGHDARPLARDAARLGFYTTVVDPRPAYANEAHFPEAHVVRAHPGELSGGLALHSRSFVVIMNHHLERDRQCLAFALASDAPYVGVLGPRSRYQLLLDEIGSTSPDVSPSSLAKVRSPVGLDIGAEAPDEVALSILAEVLAVSRGFPGGFLNGLAGRIHEPDRDPGS